MALSPLANEKKYVLQIENSETASANALYKLLAYLADDS